MIIKKNKKDNVSGNEPQKTTGKKEALLKSELKIQEPSMPIIKERQERRRGDRRRGYRRIDDRNLISRAHEEANAIKERSAKEGFDYGLMQAKEEINKLGITIAELLNAKERAMQESQSDIAYLAIKIAERIIKAEVSSNDSIVLSIVSDALKQISKDETNIIIKTNPADSQLVREKIPKLFPYAGTNAKIIVIDDEEVEWGSCIVETKSGLVDARFSTQLQILKLAFESKL